VRIRNLATNHIKYCRTHHHSTMAVATGNQIVATRVDVPAGIETGPSVLEVVVNGIASQPLNVTVATARISGHVTLQNWTASTLYVPVRVEVRAVGSTTPIASQDVLLDENGDFQLATTLPAGTYDVTVAGSHWLRGKISGQAISSTGASGLSFSLLNGDINGDNVVSIGDFNRLRAVFGTNTTGPEDLNGDGMVSIVDFNILRSSFGQIGAP
jgi:hypothetical protein